VTDAAAAAGLAAEIGYADIFRHCENAPEATGILARALEATGIAHAPEGLPMRASEDFGRFGDGAASAMVFLGAGSDHPPLHAPDYDFPDALIPAGARLFLSVIDELLGF
jgi:metal-dependent amidase/aminoacylase/carboxypeptidase family protein